MFDRLILSFSRKEFREWLLENNSKAKEFFVEISRSKCREDTNTNEKKVKTLIIYLFLFYTKQMLFRRLL